MCICVEVVERLSTTFNFTRRKDFRETLNFGCIIGQLERSDRLTLLVCVRVKGKKSL